MPKEIKDGDMKTFLLFLRGDDKIKSIAKSITIKTKKEKQNSSSDAQDMCILLKLMMKKKPTKLKLQFLKKSQNMKSVRKKQKKRLNKNNK